ncbi:YqkE family protein [Bacillus massilinigeriensis]|uniref:YqkE family protein n=1 Tax=Bacillus mediterraneensis TaxID=1805474 RepID=UPI0008F8DCC0|nr:YqkE family protein [Bacillus mediterraneensis]
MKKKKQNRSRPEPRKEEKPLTLEDLVKEDIMAELKEKQKQLRIEDEERKKREKEEEAAKKKEAQRQREKNMSFEDLLQESDMDWKKYK